MALTDRKPLPKVGRKGKQNAREMRQAKRELALRSEGQCEVVIDGDRCWREAIDPHHIGGKWWNGCNVAGNLVHVCRTHHEWFESHEAEATALGYVRSRHLGRAGLA